MAVSRGRQGKVKAIFPCAFFSKVNSTSWLIYLICYTIANHGCGSESLWLQCELLKQTPKNTPNKVSVFGMSNRYCPTVTPLELLSISVNIQWNWQRLTVICYINSEGVKFNLIILPSGNQTRKTLCFASLVFKGKGRHPMTSPASLGVR